MLRALTQWNTNRDTGQLPWHCCVLLQVERAKLATTLRITASPPPPRKKATTDTNKLEPPSRSHTETESTSSTHKSPQIKETEGIP